MKFGGLLVDEGESHAEWFEGNFQDYERDKMRRLGTVRPSRGGSNARNFRDESRRPALPAGGLVKVDGLIFPRSMPIYVSIQFALIGGAQG
jgi:hypothetical protein